MTADHEARRRIREDLDTTFVVEAAAGTGKTTELTSRMVAILARGRARLDEIVAVTFTEKAAGEMKLRLRTGIEKARTAPDVSPAAKRNLDQSLALLEAAKIGTIHSLCSDLLHERPVEASVDPLFTVGAEEETAELFDQAFDRWFFDTLSAPPEGIRRMLRRRPRGRDRVGPRDLLRDAAYKLADRRDYSAPWRRAPWDRSAAIEEVLRALRAAAAIVGPKAPSERDWVGKNLLKISRFLEELDRQEGVRGRDEDGLEADLREIQRWSEWKWRGGGFNCKVPRNDAVTLRDNAKRSLDAFLDAASADLAACLFHELWPVLDRYRELKKRAGRLDFLDLLIETRRLLVEHRSVREELQARYKNIFVDELQDTDPLQAEILLLLAAQNADAETRQAALPAPGKLFLVGDPKQSIYRFRRADVAFYEETKTALVRGGAEVLYLSTSFRSSPAIQHAVNAAFSPLMRGESKSQARYVALQPFRDEGPVQPAIVALPIPKPYSDWGKITSYRIEASTPEAVASFIEALVDPKWSLGWTVSERERPSERVPIAARHICILFKRFQSFGDDLTRPYVRALEGRRIPHVLVGGRSFHEREEVIALRSALSAIEWPDDELNVFAALRGPFFAVGDDLLLAYRDAHKTLHPLRAVALLRAEAKGDAKTPLPPHEREVAEALCVLGKLHAGRNRRPLADTIGALFEATRAHAGLAIWPTGEQALANVLRVMDLARRFEARGATSFRAFVERLGRDADQGEAAEAPVVEEGTDGVRLMTVHRAKGLEFPVVVLADPTAPHTLTQPTRFVETVSGKTTNGALGMGRWFEPLAGNMPIELYERREEVLAKDLEEAHRLAYVAATRARDLLVVPVVGDARVGDPSVKGWVDTLHPALYPADGRRKRPEKAPGCPAFSGWDTVLDRGKAEITEDASVAPGLHRPQVGEHTVVWWDPLALPLDRERVAGLRQQRILHAEDRAPRTGTGELRHAAWRERRGAAIAAGSAPSLVLRGATDIAADAAMGKSAPTARGIAIGFERARVPGIERPRGKRFGVLVHAVLAEVDWHAGQQGITAMASAHGRLIGATDDEVEAAIGAVTTALAHPVLVRAAAADRIGFCRRETPIVRQLSDGTVLDGVVDLAFRDGTSAPSWTVVDYKTDDPTTHFEQYAAQVALYVEAIAEATGERATGVILAV